jgi:hypothetical protein
MILLGKWNTYHVSRIEHYLYRWKMTNQRGSAEYKYKDTLSNSSQDVVNTDTLDGVRWRDPAHASWSVHLMSLQIKWKERQQTIPSAYMYVYTFSTLKCLPDRHLSISGMKKFMFAHIFVIPCGSIDAKNKDTLSRGVHLTLSSKTEDWPTGNWLYLYCFLC